MKMRMQVSITLLKLDSEQDCSVNIKYSYIRPWRSKCGNLEGIQKGELQTKCLTSTEMILP